MANTFITPTWVAGEALMHLENNLVAAGLVTRGKEDEFQGRKKGDTITIRRPASFVAEEFSTATVVQAATEGSSQLTLEKHFDVTFEVTSKDYTLNLEDFSEQLVQPAVIALAQAVDAYILGKVGTEVFNAVGTAADPPDSIADVIAIDKKLNDLKFPVRNRVAILNTQAKADLMLLPEFHSAEKRGDGGEALENASLGNFMGIRWYMDQNVGSHTAGTASGATTDATGYAVGLKTVTLAIAGTGTILAGDVITFANHAQQYVVTTGDADVSNAGTISFEPGLQTALPTATQAITVVAAHATNVAFNPFAGTLAIVPLALPQGSANASIVPARNMGMRVVMDYDHSAKKDLVSLDFLCGFKWQQPELAVRILG